MADVAKSGGSNQSLVSGLSNYNNNQWYFVMFTRDAVAWYLFVNGAQVNAVINSLTAPIVNAQELWIGRSAYLGGSYQWVGDIGQIFVYNRALAGDEVVQDYNATKATYGL